MLASLSQAIDFAHANRIVHRDLKPENIRVTDQGLYKVLDFGVAKRFTEDDNWRFAGTPAYASPEQLLERPSDGRSDQYSLAVIVYEMLSGKRPFQGLANANAILEAHRSRTMPLPLSQLVPTIPQGVSDAVMRALDKDPPSRFESCAAFATAMGCRFTVATTQNLPAQFESSVRARVTMSLATPMVIPHPAYLVVADDELWLAVESVVYCWSLNDIEFHGSRLSALTVRLRIGNVHVAAKLPGTSELQDLCGFLEGPVKPRRTDNVSGIVGPIDVGQRLHGISSQLLGAVRGKGVKLKSALACIAIQAARLGGQAIFDTSTSKRAMAAHREWHASGNAMKAVDKSATEAMASRWYGERLIDSGGWAFLVVMLSFVGLLFTILSGWHTITALFLFIAHTWTLLGAVRLRAKSPEFAVATAVSLQSLGAFHACSILFMPLLVQNLVAVAIVVAVFWLPANSIWRHRHVIESVCPRSDHPVGLWGRLNRNGPLIITIVVVCLLVIGLSRVGVPPQGYWGRNPSIKRDRLQIFYSGEATKADAQKLASVLHAFHVVSSGHKADVKLSANSSGLYTVSFLANSRVEKTMIASYKKTANLLASNGFSHPLRVEICDNKSFEIMHSVTSDPPSRYGQRQTSKPVRTRRIELAGWAELNSEYLSFTTGLYAITP